MAIVVFLSVWVVVISVYDLRQRRVPNAALILVLVPALLALAVQHTGLLGVGILGSFAGAAIAFAATIPGYIMKSFGAGDVKFATCLGLLLGASRGIEMVLGAFILIGMAAFAMRFLGYARKHRFAAAPMLAVGFLPQMISGPFLPIWQRVGWP